MPYFLATKNGDVLNICDKNAKLKENAGQIIVRVDCMVYAKDVRSASFL